MLSFFFCALCCKLDRYGNASVSQYTLYVRPPKILLIVLLTMLSVYICDLICLASEATSSRVFFCSFLAYNLGGYYTTCNNLLDRPFNRQEIQEEGKQRRFNCYT
ncbi:hypothetical protein, unlikely [Trypanosoma brucei gambiense DAL972]|uniref:Uncharacterized protein n=1 Tax=Trypanosoma brucei gambiense (strain MHOM/CI/86/DAL972) TaxID=679716 RepID=C9ZT66_TRYB9|nr:hypothetical protein, unlikely [Trypanosoma brucei gambiense DAL972]CBH12601.1 hypothetical protein, unlikely [Trypanosoma brucei gambiense DAL972]|eukprot:XP_011774881.1 hypothetical protein, unlikely [Trypanosoma brucei gambiense DAL972]